MPGARLTQEDRHEIEAWLAEGLGFAEIGRRLGRPTSTISREVARNRPAGGYVSDSAQQAADRRARRSRPARAAKQEQEQEQASETAGRFVDEFAALLAATGMPRMTARIFVSLLTAEGISTGKDVPTAAAGHDAGLTSADLVDRLKVSPASVSKSIAYLEGMGLVLRRADRAGRRERYFIDDDVWLRAWRADTGAHGDIATAARRGIEIFGAGTTAGRRLGRMGQFFGGLSEQMSGSTLAEPVAHDALTVVAALVHAGQPLTLDTLAGGLGWAPDRVTAALDAIARRPALADPLALRVTGPATYAIGARPDRLSPAQRAALA